MYVAPSTVHGNGLFASTNIKRNQKILTLSGTWMKLDEFMRKYPNYEGEWNYDKHTNAVLFREIVYINIGSFFAYFIENLLL